MLPFFVLIFSLIECKTCETMELCLFGPNRCVLSTEYSAGCNVGDKKIFVEGMIKRTPVGLELLPTNTLICGV